MMNNSADMHIQAFKILLHYQDRPLVTSVGETQDSAKFMTEGVAWKANLVKASCNSVIKKPFLDMHSFSSVAAPS